MKISEKLSQFSEGRLVASYATDTDLECLKIGRHGLIAPAFAEPSVSVQSGIISEKGRCFFGSHSYMNNGGYVRSNVFVGRYASIGRRVTLGAGEHSMSRLSTSPALSNIKTAHPYTEEEADRLNLKVEANGRATTILNDVWIGDGSVILSGITIGTGAVIGANSVVTKDVPAYAIAAGAPARIIRKRFPSDVAKALLKTEWWEMPRDFLKTIPLDNIFRTIEIIEAERHQIENDRIKTFIAQ